MKRFASVGLSILCLSLVATPSVEAGTHTEHISMTTAAIGRTANPQLTPFNLVFLAYQGEYQTQGIPGFNSFNSAIYSKTITAKDLVKAAIDANQLSPNTLANRGYLHAVELQLSTMKS